MQGISIHTILHLFLSFRIYRSLYRIKETASRTMAASFFPWQIMDGRLLPLNTSFINEIIRAMGLSNNSWTQTLIRFFFEKSTLRFADMVLGLDREIEQHGSMLGARWLLKHFVTGFDVNGAELIPQAGPLIIASNHPASYDGMVIAACVPRKDFKIIIGDIPPYRFLPHISKHAIFSPPVKNTFGRMQTVRSAIHHLRNGGALLIFPRGGIEPAPPSCPIQMQNSTTGLAVWKFSSGTCQKRRC